MMKNFLLCLLIVLSGLSASAQTSWTGITSTDWFTASNWTNGVPSATVPAILGDASFTGTFQPKIITVAATAGGLTLANAKATTLTVSYTLTVSGNVLINSGSAITATASKYLYVSGNWTNNGTYTATGTGCIVCFNGTAQTIDGTTATTFRKLTINAGSIVSLNTNISCAGAFALKGTIIPSETTTPVVSGAGTITVSSGGKLRVNAATFAGNYTTAGPTLSSGSIVEYSASLVNQAIAVLSYSTLTLSGGTIKTPAGNLTLISSSSTVGNIYVNNATLDLSTYTANRTTTVVGGTLSVLAGNTLRIGGLTTSFFPANYKTVTLATTSNTEYYGAGTQLVSAQTYGNLLMTTASGAAVRTMPATAFTINGNLVSRVTGGTLSCTAGSAITVSGNDSINVSTTFDAGAAGYIFKVNGNLYNNGTINGNTSSTITMGGTNTVLSGTGTNNFNNLTINAAGVTATNNAINVSGNLTISLGSGTFAQAAGGTLTMSGAAGVISGAGFSFNTLNMAGGASVSTTADFIVSGDLTAAGSGSFSATAGTVTMTGNSKTISASAGTLSFYTLAVSSTGSVSTAANFTILSSLNVQGSFTASANTATFNGTSSLNGTANLYNVAINSTKSLQLTANASLGIAGVFTNSGTFNSTATTPNTVTYNGAAQSIAGLTYYNLAAAGSGTKTTAAAITVNGDLTINASVTFNAGASSYNHTIQRNLVNNGIFSAGNSTITFSGTMDAGITGATAFNIITVNKSSSSNVLTAAANISAATVNMTTGNIATGTNTLTITGTRSGNGIITGIITRTHSFTAGTAYSFEGANNLITFTGSSSVTSVTEKITPGAVADFSYGGSVNRVYDITNVTGSFGAATLRLHYEDAELNGNAEATMQLWHYNGSAWAASGKTSNDVTNNYVEQTGIASITNRWTFSNDNNVVSWNGSVNTDWGTAGNWTIVQGTPSRPPSSNDIAQIGDSYFTGSNQPVISTAASVKGITYGSFKASALTLTTGGSLMMGGNIAGTWTANATHTINTNAQDLTVNGNINLSDGTTNHAINLNIGTGNITVGGSLTQTGGANIIFSGAGSLNIAGDFNYSSGTFTAGTGTLTYNGINTQAVAPVNYNNLAVNKSSGVASINNTTIGGNLTATSGELDINAKATITGNILISAAGKIIKTTSDTLLVGGNWTNNGLFTPSTGAVLFNGAGAQIISGATTFNRLLVSKAAGTTLTLGANAIVNSDLLVTSGNLDLGIYTANRAAAGGTFSLANGSVLYAGGTNNFPALYSTYTIDTTNSGTSATVIYNGSSAQTVYPVAYGNLSFSGSGTKTFAAGTTNVKGNLAINSGATVDASSATMYLWGNWNNSGTFTPSTSTLIFSGANKTITGNTLLYTTLINGSYTVAGSDLTFNSALTVSPGATFAAGSGTMLANGDFTNSGSASSSGTITFSGTTAQNIRVQNALSSTSAGIVNFNGTFSPVFNSTSNTTFATVNINNTAGVSPDIPWTVAIAFNVAAGATWNGGAYTHNFIGSFTNNGTVSSAGVLNFAPSSAQTLKFSGTSFNSTGNVILGGTGAIITTGAATTFTDLAISNTTGVSPGTNWTIANDLSITGGGILNAGGNTYNVTGSINCAGTLNPGTSTFNMTGNGEAITGNANTTFYDLSIASGAFTSVNADFNIARNLATTGNIDAASAGTINFTGGTASVISGAGTSLSQFTIAKNTGIATTLARNVDSLQILNVTGGIFDASAYTLTQDPTPGAVNIMSIGAAGTFRTAGIFPAVTNYTLDSLSTTEYYSGSAQTIKSLSAFFTDGGAHSAYGKMIISGAGTKTAGGTLNIKSDLTLSTGALSFANYADTLGGSWNMPAGTFTPGTGALVFSGSALQNISSTGPFNNITINKTANYLNLTSDVTAPGTTTFVSGKIYTNANKFISAAGTVTGAAQNTGWVNGNLQKTIATGAVSKTFETGSSTNYSPVTVSFTNVTTGGNLSAKANAGEHPQIAGAGIDSTKDVNLYWTLTNSGIVFTNSGATASAIVNWNAADMDAGATAANFITSLYNSGSWTWNTNASPLATSIQVTGLTSFGDIAAGERGTRSWTGAVSTVWNLAGNWSPASIPASTEDLTIPVGSSININSAVTCNNLLINDPGVIVSISSGNSLTVNGSLTLTNGILDINGQTLTLNGSFNGSAANYIRGSKTSALLIGSGFSNTGTALYFDQTISTFNNYLKTFTVSKTVTLGNALNMAAAANAATGTVSLAGGATLNTGGYLTLKSDNTGTARIAALPVDGSGVATAFINGAVTLERYIPARRTWRLLSSPLSSASAPTINAAWQEGATTASGIPNPNPGFGTHITGGTVANGFDQSPTNGSSIKYFNTGSSSLQVLPSTNIPITTYPGYYMYVRGDRSVNLSAGSAAPATTTILRMKGSVNTGKQITAVAAANYTLVGNPFASAIDFGSLTRTNVSNTIYIWDPALGGANGVGGYVTGTWNAGTSAYVFTGSVSPVSQYVPSGEAFFVKSADGINPGTVTIKEADKSTAGSDQVFGFTAPMNGASMRVNLLTVNNDSSTVLNDGTLTIYGDDNSNDVTSDDAGKLSNTGENISINRNGTILSIEQRQSISDNDTMPLSLSHLKAQHYRLQITPSGMDAATGLTAVLKDNYDPTNDNKALPLNSGTDIDFTVMTSIPASFAANRFSIVYTASPLILPVNFTSVTAARDQKNINVSWKTENEVNMQSYEVQSSTDAVHFTPANALPAHVNQPGIAYQWIDLNATTDAIYYRIKGLETTGHAIYSSVIKVAAATAAASPVITIIANTAAGNTISFSISDAVKDKYSAALYDMSGRLVHKIIISYAGGSQSFSMPTENYAPGRYNLRLSGSRKTYTASFIKF